MKNIALIVDEINPIDGGGYTLQKDILISLIKRKLKKVNISIFYGSINNEIDKIIKNKFKIIKYKKKVKIDFLKIFLNNLFNLNFNTELDKVLDNYSINTALFIGASGMQVKKKYISTCWDLMHLTHSHFKEFKNIKNWVLRYLNNKFLYKNSYKIIVGTNVGKFELQKYYQIEDNQIYKIPHPTPSFVFKKKIDYKNLEKSKYILYPAQFWEHKNHQLLIDLMKIIKEKKIMIKLILLGSDKGELNVIINKINKFHLNKFILIKGFVSEHSLVNYYKNAFALVYPSFCGPENLPPLEAMACGCPVLVSDIQGHREQLGNSVLYFDPLKPMNVFQELQKLNDRNFRLRLTKLGYKRSKLFKSHQYISELLNLIK